MNITTTLDLGDKVRTIYTRHDVLALPCVFCRGQRQLRVNSPTGDDYAFATCPRCEGRGEARLAMIPMWEVSPTVMTVGLIEARVTWDTDHRHALVERYMCEETGVGGGTIYEMAGLFVTKEDAQEAVDERNRRIREGTGGWKPERRAVDWARAFLDHRDVYEHTEEHVKVALMAIAAFEYVPEADGDES